MQDSEGKLQDLVDKMESKVKQIGIVSQQMQSRCVKKGKPAAKNHHTCQMQMSQRDASVKFLQNMKAIQTTLQQDDLSWD